MVNSQVQKKIPSLLLNVLWGKLSFFPDVWRVTTITHFTQLMSKCSKIMEEGTAKLDHKEIYSDFHRPAWIITLYYVAMAIHTKWNHVSQSISLLHLLPNADGCLDVGYWCGVSLGNSIPSTFNADFTYFGVICFVSMDGT